MEEKSQRERVSEVVKARPRSIKEVACLTKILEPNVRRILGVGAKDGTFERVRKGVYVLKTRYGNFAYVEANDAVVSLARMAEEGIKFDSIILDPAYFSRALVGGNRGVKKWSFIMPADFAKVMSSVSQLTRTEESHVYLMLSGARSAQQDMQGYVSAACGAGFKIVGEGRFTKLQIDGKQVLNVRGEKAAPERLLLLTKSGIARAGDIPIALDFHFARPPVGKGYQTEKPAGLMRALIEQSTLEDEIVLDPFAGSGVVGVEALRAKRSVVLVEKSAEAVERFILPRITRAVQSVSLGQQLTLL
jgi:hypothetical protein